MRPLSPRLGILYLLGLAIGVFVISSPRLIVGVACVQIASWFLSGLSLSQLLTQLRKLTFFSVVILASYGLASADTDLSHWIEVGIAPVVVWLHIPGLETGGMMLLRLVSIVIASRVVRAGDEQAIAQGLSNLGLPPVASASIDTVLALVGDAGGGRGAGGGGGSGGGARGRNRQQDTQGAVRGFLAALRELAKGDAAVIARRVGQQVERASSHAEKIQGDGLDPASRRDIGIIAGLSLSMLGIRALKILPSVPFAPGHKLVVLTPLYVVAGLLSKSRLGSTLTGFSMGSVSFLLGDGRYGVFEVAKHVAPGAICDLGLPLILRGGRRPANLEWALFGGLIAAGRFATIFAITLLAQPPALAYAFLLPGLAIHLTFGLLSGYVIGPLLRGIDHLDLANQGINQESNIE